ncbi:TPA: hypothetical protein NKZ90_002153 [Vibrio parahaemolyticus]|nr:hypothetical protein [Vibrio parahaemolyticus]
MREQIKNLTPESLLSIAKPSGELFYYNGNDSTGIAEIFTDSKSFDFVDAEEKAHARYLIQSMLASNEIVQVSSILYQLKNNSGFDTRPTKSETSNIIDEDILEVKPNFFGIGINLNALFRKYLQ